MNQTDTLMTYDQWCQLFKKRLKKTIKRKVYRFLYGAALFLILAVPPIAMIINFFSLISHRKKKSLVDSFRNNSIL